MLFFPIESKDAFPDTGRLSFNLPALAADFLAPIVGLTHTADFYGIALRSSSRSCGTGARRQLQRVI